MSHIDVEFCHLVGLSVGCRNCCEVGCLASLSGLHEYAFHSFYGVVFGTRTQRIAILVQPIVCLVKCGDGGIRIADEVPSFERCVCIVSQIELTALVVRRTRESEGDIFAIGIEIAFARLEAESATGICVISIVNPFLTIGCCLVEIVEVIAVFQHVRHLLGTHSADG